MSNRREARGVGPGSIVAGHRIEAVIGRGGMGVVYRARALGGGRAVAIKVIAPRLADDPEFRARFQRESELAASMDDPHVIPVYETGEHRGQLFVAMRLVEGTDLARLLSGEGPLPPRRAAGIVAAAGEGLESAHDRGLVHRDVKPANILIEPGPEGDRVYLTDFGLTKPLGSETMTSVGVVLGTPDYMAPEQLEGEALEARSDVFSLGCVLFEAVTGTIPFRGDTVAAKLYAIAHENPPRASEIRPGLPGRLDDVISRALAKRPGERFPTAGSLGRAALAATGGEPESAAAAAAAPPSERPTDLVAGTGGSPVTGVTERVPPTTEEAPTEPAPPIARRAGRRDGVEGRRGAGVGRGRRRLLWGAAALGLAGAAAIAVLALGGGDRGGAPEADRGDAVALMGRFERAFSEQRPGRIKGLLTSGAAYEYPGEAPGPAIEEYRSLFSDLDVEDYRLDLSSLQRSSEGFKVEADYRYDAGGVPHAGSATYLLGPRDGDGLLGIDRVEPRPDLGARISGLLLSGRYRVSAASGEDGPEIARETVELQGGLNVEATVLLDVPAGGYEKFDPSGELAWRVEALDDIGLFDQSFSEAYPYAS